MNLPQICSVLVIFSLVILLGFGSVGTAEALKSSGVYQTEINSAKVCGDKLCGPGEKPSHPPKSTLESSTPSDSFIPVRGGSTDCFPGPNKDLSNCNLYGVNWSGKDLSGADFEGAMTDGCTGCP